MESLRKRSQGSLWRVVLLGAVGLLGWMVLQGPVAAFSEKGEGVDLPEVLARGELRHLGDRYGNFITGTGDGFTLDIMRGFAEFLGVRHRFVPASLKGGLQDLLGQKVIWHEGVPSLEADGEAPLRGDVMAGGFAALSSRGRVVAFSNPTLISQLWAITRKKSPVKPIVPSGNMKQDIHNTITKIRGLSIMGIPDCVTDPCFWLEDGHCPLVPFQGTYGELIPGLLEGRAQVALVDMTDVILGTLRWPGRVKVVGPLSPPYYISAFFRKSSPKLRQAFNEYLRQIQGNGKYMELIRRYYPSAEFYFPDFFKNFSHS